MEVENTEESTAKNTDESKPEDENKSKDSTEEKKDGKPKETLTAGAAAAANPHYRVKISGLPRFYTPTDPLLLDFKRLLHDQLGLQFKYIRSPKKGNSWLYITFYDQVNQEKALKLLKQYKWKGRTLICTLVVADVLKRKQEDSGGDESSKKPRLDISIEEQMLMSTIPYHTVSYEEQLSKKNEEAQCLFKWLAVCMEKKTPKLIGYIDQQIAKNTRTRLPFKLDQVRASPVIDGYRNKCEFRIGNDPTTNKVVVGYRVDNQEDDIIAVAPPDTLRHLPKEMIDVCKVFEKYVQESQYPAQKANHDPGVWRLLHVRINRAKQLMVVVLINPTVLDDAALAALRQELIQFFSEGPGSNHNVISLYLHTDNDLKLPPQGTSGDKVKRPTGHLELIWGQSHMEEQLLDLQLEIDPNFYFQSNTWGAEELYKAVVELAGVDADTTVLDLCCGSGGMGMMFAKHCKEVIGVELMDVNVDDAKRLAAKNGLTNCEFLQGAVDDLLPELEEKLKGKKVVPILDPPRVGISAKLILSLRKMAEAQRIIYVCSNHKLPSKNIMDMSLLEGEKQEYVGTDPFFPTRVIPVDISPHSLRCELVILLERLDMTKVPKPKRSAPNRTIGCLYYGWSRRPFDKSRGGGRGLRGGRGPRSMDRGMRYPRGHPYDDFEPRRGRDFDYFDNGLNRYSDFRREVEDAIDSYPPPRGQVSKRLAMANAMLEQGIRLASEAMAEDYSMPPGPPPPYIRGGRGRGAYMRVRGGPVGSWGGNPPSGGAWPPPPPAAAWRNWEGEDFPPGRGSRGLRRPAKMGRGGINSAGSWRR